ncbi:tandem-95 repeat protein, partial [Pseudoalteromonas distincta]|uniref:tandem-95 repeat protein n=1 Tax=Pseudoalteromonas distincta TaxID=77608 RepID=UPI00165F63E3
NQIQYTPAANTNGLATVTYTVSDNNGGTNTATVAVTITAVNDAPVANNDTATMAEDAAPILINVLANDSDEDGDSLTISAASADIGSASVVGNQIQYTPAANTNGLATVTYTVSDNNSGTNTATVAITITEVNDAPVASIQSFSISENATDGDIIGTVSASDIENQTLTYSLTGGDTASFEINSSSGVLSTVGESPFDFETTNQYILNVTITDDGTPNESSNVNITVNITDEVELLIPTEDVTFGRPITGELDLSNIFSGGEFKDSIELNGNLYFVGFTNNADKDLLIVSYSNNGDMNTAFNNTGTKILDLDQDEEATAIISDGTDLFIAYSSFDGTHNEACILKMDLAGTLSTGSDDDDDDDDGESGAGIQCTTLNSTTVINDLEIDDNKILAVGKYFDGTQNDSLWIHYKKSDLDFENSTPAIVDVSGANRDDEGFAIKNFDKSDYLVVGTVTSAEGTKDSLIRYLKSDGDNDNNFNGGSALIIDISDNNKDDELFAVGGVVDSEFTAFAGGYITRNSGEKEAVVLAIDKTGTLITSFGDAGTAIYDIDGNGGNGNGGAKITGIKHEPSNNGISLSGTTGVSVSEKLFSARINSEGTLDSAYGTSGINIIDGISGKQYANTLAIDSNDTIWVAGVNDDSNTKPFIAAIDSQATLFSNFETNGYFTLNNLVDATNDESMHVLQLSNGPNVGKYILASTAKSDSVTKLVLTRFTSAGDIDTSFSESGHKEIAIDLSKSRVALTEQSDGNLVITGSKNSENGEAGFVAKVDQSGNLDSSFATDGVYTTSVSGAELVNLTDIALDNSGNIITVGSIVTSGTPSPIVIMLTPEGTLEPNFGTGGSIIGSAFEYYNRVHTDNADIFIGGKSVLSGTSKLIALKLSSNGTETFKYVGEETTDTDNKIVQILTDTTGKLYLIANLIDSPNKANVIRLLVTGTLDTSFAVNGVGEYTLASTGNTELSGAALDSSDQLILAGKANNKGMLARILTDGTLDNTFGASGAGFYEASQCVSTHVFTSIILQNDTQVVVSSTCNDTNSNNVSISKFNFEADGA